MAGKTIVMSTIKQLIQLHRQGMGKKPIARTLSISKNTVKAYLEKVKASPLKFEQLMTMDDPELEAHLHAGSPAYKQSRYDQLKDMFPYLVRELSKTGVTKYLLWQEYCEKHSDCYSYTQFCFHLSQHLSANSPSMVLHHNPGDKLFVDFAGQKMAYVDTDTGEKIACHILVATLPYSDYGFAIAVPSQSIEDFIYALNCCLLYFGGVPEVLVPDNLKSAVTKANRYEPTINRLMEDFGNHYDLCIVPTRTASPKDKALVENHVKLFYNRVHAKLRNQTFLSLSDLNKAIAEKMRAHNQTRMQNYNHCREEKFLAEEKPLLKSLPDKVFEIKYYRQLKVAQNNHICLNKVYYSVPFKHIGRKVTVIYTRSLVRIYCNGDQVALHPRDDRRKYNTIKEHLCSHHRHYLSRSPDYFIRMASRRCSQLEELVRLIFSCKKGHPEQHYRTCEGLLSLQRKSEAKAFQQACQQAIIYENYSYQFVSNMLKNKMTEAHLGITQQKEPPVHTNIRGKDYYF
jgi:transposase